METLYWIQCKKIEENFSLSERGVKAKAFILCDDTTDDALIDRIATELGKTGCRESHFYGRQEKRWHNIFDENDLKTEGRFTLTVGYKSFADFTRSMWLAVGGNEGETTVYLLYDDEELFQKVVTDLMGKRRTCPLMGYTDIGSENCSEISMVADRFLAPSWLPEQVKEKENFCEICQNCKYHNLNKTDAPKIDMNQPKTKIVLDTMERLFEGEYDPLEFSYDFPSFCCKYYDELENECEGLGYYLDQVVSTICDECEPDFDPTHMIEELQKVYRMAKRKAERGGGIVLLDKVTIKVNLDEIWRIKNSDEKSVVLNEHDTLVVDRVEETIEYSRDVFAGSQIVFKCRLENYLASLLSGLDARDLFCWVGEVPQDAEQKENINHIYEITIEAEGMETRVIKGPYCADALPDDYEGFVRLIANAMNVKGMLGDIFDRKLYKKSVGGGEEWIYCAVEFPGSYGEYHYITDDDTIEEGDTVIVPAGKKNRKKEAVVVQKMYCTEKTAPYPPEKAKRIIRKAE